MAPTSGVMELNGVKLEDWNRRAWRTEVTYMPRRIYSVLAWRIMFALCAGGDHSASRGAVEAAGLSDLVKSLPGGLAEMIGGGGRTLSGGQAQRVALARALGAGGFSLDEPTAHLDIETEYELKERMLSLFKISGYSSRRTDCTGCRIWITSSFCIRGGWRKREPMMSLSLGKASIMG